MSTTTMAEYRHFIAGEWSDAGSGKTFDDTDPYTGDVVAQVAAGTREDAARAIEAAAAAFPEWSQTPPTVRQGLFLKAADILESRRDEIVSLLARETGCTFGFGMFQMGFTPGLLRQAAGAVYTPVGEVIPSGPAGRPRAGHPPAGGCRRGDRALERSAHPLPALARSTDRVRQHRRPQAVRALAVHGRAGLGRDLRRGGLPGRRPEHRHARARGGGTDRRRARREPGGAADQLHGLDADRTQARGSGRAQPQAGRARARRLQPADRPRRRRRRVRGGRLDLRIVPPPGADLHVGTEDHRRALHRGRPSSRSSSRRRGHSSSAIRASTTRSSDRSSPRPLSRRSRHVSTTPSRRAPRSSSAARLSAPATRRRSSPRSRTAASSRGSRRSGRSPRSRSSTTRTLRSSGRTRPATGSRRGSSRPTPIAGSGSRSGSRRGSSTSTTSPSTTSRRCRSAASRTAAGAGSAAVRRWRSSRSCGG